MAGVSHIPGDSKNPAVLSGTHAHEGSHEGHIGEHGHGHGSHGAKPAHGVTAVPVGAAPVVAGGDAHVVRPAGTHHVGEHDSRRHDGLHDHERKVPLRSPRLAAVRAPR